MISLLDFDPWWRFGMALLIGSLLGLEREFIQQKEDAPDFAGIRTFALIALLGAVAAFLTADMGILPAAISFSGLILLAVVSYIGDLIHRGKGAGITTEVAAMLTFLFGVLVMSDKWEVAIALSVITALLLSLKGRLHDVIRKMTSEDLFVTLQFALVAAVILPLLPNRAIDPLGLLNPFQVWLVVVFVSAIGFSGYVLMKVLGPARGINLTGVLGGLVSSTATTISFSTRSRETPALSAHFAQGVVLASSVMVPRMLLLVLVIYPPLLRTVIIPLSAMLVAGLVVVLVLQRKYETLEQAPEQAFTLAHPLKLMTAIKFGLMFAVVFVIVEFALDSFGSVGVYFTSAIAGLTDVNAITLSLSRLVEGFQLNHQVAGIAIIIAALTNTIAKGAIAYFAGSPELRRRIIPAFSFVVLVGAIGTVIMLLVNN